MVSPTVLPGDAFAEHLRRSTLLFHWRAQDLGLRTVDRSSTGTFTRASLGGLVSGRGQITDAADTDVRLVGPHADNQPRFGVSSAGIPNLTLEALRTNGRTFSEQFDNEAYTPTRLSITPDAVVAPDGLTTADKLVEDGTANDSHRLRRNFGSGLTDDTDTTVSFFAKAAERTWISAYTINKANRADISYFDIGNGVTGIVDANHTVRIKPQGNGWYRCIITIGSESGVTGPRIYIELATGDGARSYSGDGSSGLYAWGLQVEIDQPSASSYIPTVGSTVTRAVESLSFPFLPVPQEMTVYLKFVESGTISAGGNKRVFHIGASNIITDPRLWIEVSAGRYRVFHDNGPTQVNKIAAAAPSIGDLVELRAVLGSDGSVLLGQSINGAAEVNTSASGAAALTAAWADTLFWPNGPGNQGFNAFVEIKVESGTKTMQQMRESL